MFSLCYKEKKVSKKRTKSEYTSFSGEMDKARFKRRISAVSNAIETIDNGMIFFIIFCLNCIWHGRNATYEPGLSEK